MHALTLLLSLAVLSSCSKTPEQRLARGLAAKDPSMALEDLGAACEAGLAEACAAAGALPLDDPRKEAWDERACEGSILAACLRRTRAPDDPFARRACDLGDAPACGALAAATGEPSAHRKACLGGHLPSCLPAGDAARKEGDLAAAAELYGARCAKEPGSVPCLLAERAGAPSPVGEIPWPEGDPAAISERLWSGCAANDAWDCLRLAEHVERQGGPLPKSARGGPAWLRDQACDLQLVYACAPHAW